MEPAPKILIVEDDPRGRETLAALLNRSQGELLFAANGHEALALAPEAMPDLVLLDVMLPDLDGFEICRRLRAEPRLAEVPIVMITALDDRDSRLRGFEAGADDFLSKPFDRMELQTRVRSTLRLNRFRHLVQEREKFADVINFFPDGLLVTGLDGVIALANPAMLQMLGLEDLSPAKPGTVGELVAPGRQKEFNSWLVKVSRSLDTRLYQESEFFAAGRKPFPVELSGRRFLWQGQPAIQIHVRDVSDEKLLEAKFLRAQRLESIGTLAGGIAHDLNNILTPILASARMLKDDLKDHPSRRWVDLMETSAQRGSNIIQQILAFTRGTETQRELLRVKYFVEEMRRIVSETFPGTIQFRHRIAADTGMIRGDSTQMQQVLMNLCVNARDAMPEGGVLKIEVANRRIDRVLAAQLPGAKPGEYVAIAVSDTGCGMAPEIRDQIFEAFFTTKPVGKGTGLGLSTVRTIVQDHGGFISVDSEVGRGTTFTVFLPAEENCETNRFTREQFAQMPRGSGEHILVAENDPAIVEILQATLERAGYRVSVARDGAEAVAMFAQDLESIHLLLVDSSMPVLGGFALVRTLQRLGPVTRLCVMCDSLTQSRLVEQLGDRTTGFLLKPFSAEHLLDTVAKAIHQHPAAVPETIESLAEEYPSRLLGLAGAAHNGK
jgi:two-component system, cell cycle sensor histidine kinase and response regulator CckA